MFLFQYVSRYDVLTATTDSNAPPCPSCNCTNYVPKGSAAVAAAIPPASSGHLHVSERPKIVKAGTSLAPEHDKFPLAPGSTVYKMLQLGWRPAISCPHECEACGVYKTCILAKPPVGDLVYICSDCDPAIVIAKRKA